MPFTEIQAEIGLLIPSALAMPNYSVCRAIESPFTCLVTNMAALSEMPISIETQLGLNTQFEAVATCHSRR